MSEIIPEIDTTTKRIIIDTHVHMFPNKLFDAIWDYFEKNYWSIYQRIYAEQQIPFLASNNVLFHTSLLYAHKPNISRELNNWVYDLGKRHNQVLQIGTIHPRDSYFKEEVERVLSPKGLNLRGLKFQLMVTDFDPNIPELDFMYEKLVEYNKIMIMHVGTGPTAEYCRNRNLGISPHVGIDKLIPILERFPTLKIQVPHLGAAEYDEFFSLAKDYPNFYFDTAMVLVNHGIFPHGSERDFMIDDIIDLQDKIMFGSDFPNIPYKYEFSIQETMKLPVSIPIRKKIMYKNALKFYDLKVGHLNE
jgi:uncharacterized protein